MTDVTEAFWAWVEREHDNREGDCDRQDLGAWDGCPICAEGLVENAPDRRKARRRRDDAIVRAAIAFAHDRHDSNRTYEEDV
jgi:hypothetical protein